MKKQCLSAVIAACVAFGVTAELGAQPAQKQKSEINPAPTAKDWADIAKLPEERYGLVMIFRTFERAAFGLVMQSNLPVAIDDIVTTP